MAGSETKDKTDSRPVPTAGESAFLLALIQNMEGVPPVDWETFAKQNNYSTGIVAKNRFYNIKKRLGIMGTDAAAPVAKGRVTKGAGRPAKSARAKKVKAPSVTQDEEDESPAPAPASSQKGKVAYDEDADAEMQLRFEAGEV